MATRISFVGEAGWEIAVTAEHSGAVFDALCQPGVTPLGHFALDGCRIEKGIPPLGPRFGSGPVPSGSRFGIHGRLEETWFRGQEGVDCAEGRGGAAAPDTFEVHGTPLLLHDKPIREDAAVIGLTASGSVSPRTGKRLAFGIIPIEAGETLAQTAGRSFQVNVAGALYEAAALAGPPYDPDGERMRS